MSFLSTRFIPPIHMYCALACHQLHLSQCALYLPLYKYRKVNSPEILSKWEELLLISQMFLKLTNHAITSLTLKPIILSIYSTCVKDPDRGLSHCLLFKGTTSTPLYLQCFITPIKFLQVQVDQELSHIFMQSYFLGFL